MVRVTGATPAVGGITLSVAFLSVYGPATAIAGVQVQSGGLPLHLPLLSTSCCRVATMDQVAQRSSDVPALQHRT